jgi:Meiotically Up-regulated Gene 113 (MUG113) protein
LESNVVDVSSQHAGVYATTSVWESSASSDGNYWRDVIADVEAELGEAPVIDLDTIRVFMQAQEFELDLTDRATCRRVIMIAHRRAKEAQSKRFAEDLVKAAAAAKWQSENGTVGSCVYFIRLDDLIKIGTTSQHPDQRMRGMQLPPSARIVAVIPRAGYAEERELHRMFAADRVGGEWFKPSPELLSLIEQYTSTAE